MQRKMTTQWLKWSIPILVVIALAIVWAQVQKPQEDLSTTIKTIKLGAVIPMTGNQSYFGEEVQAGINYAKRELDPEFQKNGYEVNVYFEDSENNPSIAVSAARKLINTEDVKLILSLFPMCPAVNSATETGDVLHLASTMSPDIIEKENTIRIYPSMVEEAKKMVSFAKDIDAKKVAIFHLTVKAHEEMVAHLKKGLAEFGASSEVLSMGFNDIDAKAQIQKIKDFDPDLLVMILLPDFHFKVFKAIQEVGLREDLKKIGNISFLYSKLEQKSWTDNVFFVAPEMFIKGLDNKHKKFAEDFQKFSGKNPTVVSTFLYINMKILGEAILNGKTTPTEVKEYLMQKKKFQSIAGEIEILENGDCTVSLGYGVIKNGQRSIYKPEKAGE